MTGSTVGERGDRRLVVLGLDPDPVGADLRLQRRGRVQRDDLALVHDRDPIAELGLVHVVRGHEDRDLLALLELADVAPDRAAGLRIQPDRRLVEEQHPRRVHQPAGDLQPPPHAAAERPDHAVLAVVEADHLEHLPHPRRDQRGLDAVELGMQLEVLLGGQVAVERRVLEDEADVAADVVALAHHVVAGDLRAPARRLGERAEHVDRGGLAGAVRTQESEHLAGLDGERDAADGLDVPERFLRVR